MYINHKLIVRERDTHNDESVLSGCELRIDPNSLMVQLSRSRCVQVACRTAHNNITHMVWGCWLPHALTCHVVCRHVGINRMLVCYPSVHDVLCARRAMWPWLNFLGHGQDLLLDLWSWPSQTPSVVGRATQEVAACNLQAVAPRRVPYGRPVRSKRAHARHATYMRAQLGCLAA